MEPNKPIKLNELQDRFDEAMICITKAAAYSRGNQFYTEEQAKEAMLFQLITCRDLLLETIRGIDPQRFGKRVETIRQLIEPIPSVNDLDICPHCGTPGCTSDHK